MQLVAKTLYGLENVLADEGAGGAGLGHTADRMHERETVRRQKAAYPGEILVDVADADWLVRLLRQGEPDGNILLLRRGRVGPGRERRLEG